MQYDYCSRENLGTMLMHLMCSLIWNGLSKLVSIANLTQPVYYYKIS